MPGQLRIAIDIGGTFTDLTAFNSATGSVELGKALSTPSNLTEGIMAAMARTGVSPADADLMIHGSTIVINAILERRGARTALVTTQGFRDVYEIGRINRPESFNLLFRKHKPLVPRELIFEVPERMLADGTEEQPLDETAAREVAGKLTELDMEAVGIVFLHSYFVPDHEIRMRDILLEANPRLFVTASHELSREYREYERTSTTAANAYVGPIVSRYLTNLEQRLDADGFRGSLMIMQSSGGLYDVETARRQCVQMMESGPAGGVVGTMAICDALGLDNAISFDMGGTTAKACVIRRGSPDLSPDYFVGGYNEGLAIRIPVLDIKEVGTGGGSIAHIDQGGALHVGPESAGAEPGPVCYARGGTEPTITDADVALGRISPEQFLGGEMRLDFEGAARAIRQKLADPLGLSLERAADGMLAIGIASMANAVRAVTTERGLDPRDFTLVAYGGGGPPHAAAVARELAIRRVIIPQAPAHFSAFGMLLADLRRDYVLTHFAKLADLEMGELERLYQELEKQGLQALTAAGIKPEESACDRAADMRYVGQEHSVAINVPPNLDAEEKRDIIKKAFDDAHELRFSHSAPEEPAELVSLRLSVFGRLQKPGLPRVQAGSSRPAEAARRGSRDIVLDKSYADAESRAVSCALYDRRELLAGNVIHGPAVIEEPASSTLLAPGDRAEVNEYGHLVIELAR
ncbi:MAG TPA: hydantoinase/oxoprolinase family protein [Chloroflexota bacterium]|nr:hydantoinase/oxoprolinase family protein [Chloroflexota bacterium]